MPKLVTNIVFTKNRPLQLHAYLESLYRHFSGEFIQTHIVYKAELFEREYALLFRAFPDCSVIREVDFHDDFLKLLDGVQTEYILFGTDDVVYYDSVNIKTIDETFRKFPNNILGFSLRLAPESLKESGDVITKCDIAGEYVYKINWKKTQNKTAGYPFELDGTVYKTKLVKKIVSNIAKERPLLKKIFRKNSRRVRFLKSIISMKDFLVLLETFHGPNTLEGYCCRWCKNHRSKLPHYFYFQKLCCSALQVNVVNTEVNNPIFGSCEHTVEALNEKYKQGYRLDVNFVAKNKPKQTHTGKSHFQLKEIGTKGYVEQK
jgi:hypothetical protein